MKPGVTWQPPASTTLRPSSLSPIAVMRSPVMATSARRGGAPVPSTTNPPRITMSALTRVPLVPVRAIVPRTGPTHNHQLPGLVGALRSLLVGALRSLRAKAGVSGHTPGLAHVDAPRAGTAAGQRGPVRWQQTALA